MSRWVSNLILVASSAFLVFVLAVWLRSYWKSDHLFFETFEDDAEGWTRWTQYGMRVGRGGVGYNHVVQSYPISRNMRERVHRNRTEGDWGEPTRYRAAPPRYPNFAMTSDEELILGFRFDRFATGSAGSRPRAWAVQIIVPLWAVALLVSTPLMIRRIGAASRRKRRLSGRCVRCGYDLRATPDRCPECGAAPGGGRW